MAGLRFDGGNRTERLTKHIFAAFQAVWIRRGRNESELQELVTSAVDRDKFKTVMSAILTSKLDMRITDVGGLRLAAVIV